MTAATDPPSRLARSLGLGGAVTIGVSAMIGTGVFAVWQPALDRAGSWLIAAVLIAAVVAALNATSTARLAARHPEAGGVYAYGRIRVNRFAGVLAGVVFLIGKTASASAAALTIGLYVWPEQSRLVAFVAIAAVLALNLRGVVRSTRVARGDGGRRRSRPRRPRDHGHPSVVVRRSFRRGRAWTRAARPRCWRPVR
jgi:Amino acid transporters